MVDPTSALHVYDRDIQDSERTSLSVLTGHIPAGARVLDLGCGSGAIGRFLAARDGTAAGPIDGLTISADEAALAAPTYRRVEVADLDAAHLPQLFAPAGYDAIVCADVLEHIRQSPRVLAECRALLAPGGRLLLSIPNAGYSGLVAELMAGEFRYRTEGLLDETHVRFFTRRTLLRFLAEHGWAVESTEAITRQLPDSEFKVAFDALPPAVARHLLALPDALTYQFIVVARPLAAHERPSPPASDEAPALPAQALFTAELYVGTNGSYAETGKITAAGVIGHAAQTLRFPLDGTPPSKLRLDPADRPGFVHLHAMRMMSASGQLLWQWDSTDPDALLSASRHDIVLQPPAIASGGFLLLLHGKDPWLELPIDTALLAQAAGGTLEVDMGWPMSSDYLALAGAAQRLQQGRDDSARLIEQLRHSRDELQQQLSQTLQKHDATLTQNEQLRERAQESRERIQELRERIQTLQTGTHALSRERDEAMQLVRDIENSTVFRATRPLVHAKMRIDRLLGVGSARVARPRRASIPQPLTPTGEPVDIIVPVYRGLEDTQRCVRSVLSSTCKTDWRLILINDASPEPEVTDWLRAVAPTDPRITLLENEENLGFVGTVNRGMALSGDHDVLLLNSDTEVAGDWLDRIRAAAYGDQKVASVTPFSNNATICSYPRFCHDNPLPQGWTTADLDALCAQTNPGQVVDVPTGVGFCMYIRRAALVEVGLFDVENFGKGYGEENDFCVRAAQAGWRNLHALDTFVRHFGGVSFGATKSPRERAAMDTMRRLHPSYEATVIEFVRQDPAAEARAALDFARVTARKRPVILAVSHDREGGTLQHIYQLAESLSDKASMLMLRPAPGGQVSLQLAEASAEGSRLLFELPTEFDVLVQVLRDLGVRHIHFHHLLGHGKLVQDALVVRLGVTHDFTAHDFHAVCPQLSMVGPEDLYCRERGLDQCASCLRRHPAPGQVDIITWRNQNAPLLVNSRHLIAPSLDALHRLASYLPHAPYQLVPHLESGVRSGERVIRPAPLAEGARLKVAVVGALSVIKGADVLEDVARAARRGGAPIDFHLLGYAYRSLQTQPRSALTIHGHYKDEQELSDLLNWLKPDLVWFPALVPETYSYTLSEVLRAGLPVVAPNLGAFPERLRGREWSWIEPWTQTPADWLRFFERIAQENFRMGVPPPRPDAPADNPGPIAPAVTPQEAAQWYAGHYLQGIPNAETDLDPERLSALLGQHLALRRDASRHAGHKSAALRALVRLRTSPVLAPLARAIPPRWQARVKNWLTG